MFHQTNHCNSMQTFTLYLTYNFNQFQITEFQRKRESIIKKLLWRTKNFHKIDFLHLYLGFSLCSCFFKAIKSLNCCVQWIYMYICMFSVLRYHNLLMIANLNSVPAVSMKHISTDTWKNVHHKIVHVHVLYFYII